MEERKVNGRCVSIVERSFSLCMCRLGLCLTWQVGWLAGSADGMGSMLASLLFSHVGVDYAI